MSTSTSLVSAARAASANIASLSIGQTVSLVATLFLTYITSTVVYRLYFHPLAKYPGPFWACVTTWPSYWHTLRQNRHVWLWQLQEKYGSTFRYRPDGILINKPSAFHELFGPAGNMKKAVYYQVWPRNVNAQTTWNSVDLQTHGRKRRVLNYAFSDKALKAAEPFIVANTNRTCQLINQEIAKRTSDEWSGSLNMADWVNHLVFDILGDLCFGKSFGMQEPDSDMKYVPHLMVGFLELMHPIAFSPFANLWAWMKPRGLDALLALMTPPALKQWEAFVEGCMRDRTQQEEDGKADRKDFFHWLYHAVDPETGARGFPLDELYGECESLIIAGADTTATVLCAMFFYLARFPAVQRRLADEVRAGFERFEDIQAGRLFGCKYLCAFIQEGLRMTPPVSAEPSREVRPGGTVVDGQFFPAGLHVSTGMFCLSYNKEVYPEPFRFRPERWLVGEEGATEESVEKAKDALCAFSYGSRGCPGKNLAWMEMLVIVAKVVWSFKVRPDSENDLGVGRTVVDHYQTRDAFVSLRDGPILQFKRRS